MQAEPLRFVMIDIHYCDLSTGRVEKTMDEPYCNVTLLVEVAQFCGCAIYTSFTFWESEGVEAWRRFGRGVGEGGKFSVCGSTREMRFVFRPLIIASQSSLGRLQYIQIRKQTTSFSHIPRSILRLHILREIHCHRVAIQKLLLVLYRDLGKLRVRFTLQSFKQAPILVPHLHDNIKAAGRCWKWRGHPVNLRQVAAREAQDTGQGDMLVEELGVLGLIVFAECCNGYSWLAFEEADDF